MASRSECHEEHSALEEGEICECGYSPDTASTGIKYQS
jgi:hypothetical protein